MADTTLLESINSWRTDNQTGNGLLSKLNIDNKLYHIKDPALDKLATDIEERLSSIERKKFTPVTKGANDSKYATSVTQTESGQIVVTYSNLRDEALSDTAVDGQFITTVSQDVNGVVSIARAGVSADKVTYTKTSGVDLTATDVKAAIEEVLSKAMALKGVSTDESSAETIAAAKKYAKELVDNLAGEDWSENAKKVQDIIDELEGSEQASTWSTLVDKLKGMTVTEKGTSGEAGYRPANNNPTVVQYVEAKIADANQSVVDGLDATVGSTTVDTNKHVAVQVVETDGVLTGLTVTENDIASASALTTLDGAVVKSVNGVNPTSNEVTITGTNIAVSSSDSTTIDTALSNLSSTKADKTQLTPKDVIVFTAAPTFGENTLTFTTKTETVWAPVATVNP